MARTSIGLDIGTRAVSLAELNIGGHPTVTRFGRMLLPAGAVEHGEVRDPAAVGDTIAKLWKRLGMNGNKSVHVGVANRRVVVRVIELPAMSREDLAGAIRFQAQDHIPIPLDEAVMDYEVLEEIDGPTGKMQRILVVAAERGTIAPLLEAVRAAHLEAASLEFNAYPLMRCFGSESGAAQAVVDIGAGVTNIVVLQGGKIRFTRTLPNFGGDDFTQAIVDRLRVSREDAERIKREASAMLRDRASSPMSASPVVEDVHIQPMNHEVSVPSAPSAPSASEIEPAPEVPHVVAPAWGPQPIGGGAAVQTAVASSPVAVVVQAPTYVAAAPAQTDAVAEVLEPMLDRLVTEVRGSIDFYTSQPDASPLERIVLTGGGSLMGGVAERLQASLGLPTEPGHPFERVPVGKINVSKQEVAVAEPFMGVAFGLALAGSGA
ncbi:MAG: type IV pilus assembly protein PilM [Actinomycetota bacterium]